ncbi:MAG: NAD(P)/FAD-dependent oxidoreductase [Oscillospiraceae bacterium]|nr:NAD(P)/FAD-dependent oxidoreductase [Oscillospiraceae bacterium]
MFELKYPHLFSPITLAGTVFRNRIFASPTGTAHLTSRNFPIAETNAYYERKAIGGAASVCVGDAMVNRDARFNAGHIALDDAAGSPALSSLADSISRHGAIASIELSHAGSHAHEAARLGHKLFGPMAYTTDEGFPVEAMTEEKIYAVIDQFAQAAAFSKKCGYGMVTIHGGHGWLITQFMSPLTNQRTDRWGGSVENRCRFAVEVCKAVRRAVGRNFPIEMRISGSECNPNGYDLDEGIAIAKQLDGHLDLIHVSAGSHEVWDVFTVTHPDMFLPDGVNVKFAAEIKKHIKHSAVATVGALTDPAQMEEIIASGQADVVELARGLIADPDLPRKARGGREREINPCMRCLSCFSNLMDKGQFICAMNPEIGHETEVKWALPPAEKKRVLVAGGGIAGMRAAITAAERGHEVILAEKSDRLGGVLRCEDEVSFKAHLTAFLDNQEAAVTRVGVDVRLGTAVTPELARSLEPDVIIAAVGARPVKPNIPGIEHAVGAEDVYRGIAPAGQRVAILGGGLVGTELAIHLARQGREVAIVELADALSDGGNMLQGLAIRLELARQEIDVRLSTRAVEIRADGVTVERDGANEFLAADTVVYAVGQAPLRDIADELRPLAPEFHQIGDCVNPKNIVEATRVAFHVARDVGR